jgi:hypothetical protein
MNGFRDGFRITAVANKSLWQALIGVVARMRKIEWAWVNGHSSYLLNECADMLATEGVNNETPFAQVQYVVPIAEDTDTEVYELKGSEESTVGNWNGDSKPEYTHAMKDGDNLATYLSSAWTSEVSDESDSDVPMAVQR